jgi:hypothetical protein
MGCLKDTAIRKHQYLAPGPPSRAPVLVWTMSLTQRDEQPLIQRFSALPAADSQFDLASTSSSMLPYPSVFTNPERGATLGIGYSMVKTGSWT